MASRHSSAFFGPWWNTALPHRGEWQGYSGIQQAYCRPDGGSQHVQRLAVFLALTATACVILSSAGQVAERDFWEAEREGVVVQIIRRSDRGVICLRSRPPVQLSGEYGVHASWGPKTSTRDSIAVYTGQEYFTAPLKIELAIPRADLTLNLDIGACIPGELCNAVEFSYDLRKLPIAAASKCEHKQQ